MLWLFGNSFSFAALSSYFSVAKLAYRIYSLQVVFLSWPWDLFSWSCYVIGSKFYLYWQTPLCPQLSWRPYVTQYSGPARECLFIVEGWPSIFDLFLFFLLQRCRKECGSVIGEKKSGHKVNKNCPCSFIQMKQYWSIVNMSGFIVLYMKVF